MIKSAVTALTASAAFALALTATAPAQANNWQNCRLFAEEECARMIQPGDPTWDECVAFFTQLCLNDLHVGGPGPLAVEGRRCAADL
jgi:hypothetical protein